jgi:cytochrome c-type biogenesis protein CcmH/NrfF
VTSLARRVVAAFVLALAVVGPVRLAAATPAAQKDVEEALTCQCGCGLTVHSCNHLNCGSAGPMKKEIAERIARGEDKETILKAFVQRYGEKVLSSPTLRGFNWFAWITPFAAVLLAAGILTVTIRRRVHETAPEATPAAASPPGDPAMRERLARELDRLERE